VLKRVENIYFLYVVSTPGFGPILWPNVLC